MGKEIGFKIALAHASMNTEADRFAIKSLLKTVFLVSTNYVTKQLQKYISLPHTRYIAIRKHLRRLGKNLYVPSF